MPGPVATIGSMHTCPMLNPGSPPPPHVGGPVSQGLPTVLVGGKPIARMGDMCVCAGPPDSIVQGEATVLAGNMPVATIGSATSHGGVITVGEPTVLIGTGATPATTVTPVDRLQPPTITTINKIKASVFGKRKYYEEAERNQAENLEGAKKNGYLGHFDFSM